MVVEFAVMLSSGQWQAPAAKKQCYSTKTTVPTAKTNVEKKRTKRCGDSENVSNDYSPLASAELSWPGSLETVKNNFDHCSPGLARIDGNDTFVSVLDAPRIRFQSSFASTSGCVFSA